MLLFHLLRYLDVVPAHHLLELVPDERLIITKIIVPEGKHICMWAQQSMMPIFPLLQRVKPEKGDWTGKSGQLFVCPDPKGKVHYRIERIEES